MSTVIGDTVARLLASPSPSPSSVAPVEIKRDGRGRLLPGQALNPGGASKEKREFLARLKQEDADSVYAALMDLVDQRNPAAVLRCVEYIAGKPREVIDVTVSAETRQLDLGKLSDQQLDDLAVLIGQAKGEPATDDLAVLIGQAKGADDAPSEP